MATNATLGIDTFGWAGAPTTNYGTATAFYAGYISGMSQSFIKFNNLVVAPGPGTVVTNSYMQLLGGDANDCTQAVNVQGIDGTLNAGTVWNGRPAVTGTAMSSTVLPTGCGPSWNTFDTTALARSWITGGAPNNGLRVSAADEANPAGFKWFWSGNTTNPPLLFITYDAPARPVDPGGPATGAVLSTPTPTLVAPHHRRRGRRGEVLVPGHPRPRRRERRPGRRLGLDHPTPAAAQFEATCYPVPTGALSDGVTYYWHAWTEDPVH